MMMQLKIVPSPITECDRKPNSTGDGEGLDVIGEREKPSFEEANTGPGCSAFRPFLFFYCFEGTTCSLTAH